MIVVKTLSGSANAAAEAIDNMNWKEVLGTIAGDNTVFLVVRNGCDSSEIANRILNLVSEQ
jgi:transcriptional regulator of arginine metabolism